MSAKKKVVDPLASAAIVGAKTKGRDAIERVQVTDEGVATAVTEYARLDRERKAAEADAKPHKDKILAAARETFATRLAGGDDESFVFAAGDVTVQVTVPRKISSLGEAELKALAEDYGEDAIGELTEPSEAVSLNIPVWNAHADVLIAALNSTGPDGRRLVPVEVLQALFTRPVKARDDLFDRVAKRTNKDPQQIQTLLFAKLGVSPSLTVK